MLALTCSWCFECSGIAFSKIAASKIFTGDEWFSNHTIITSNGKIDKIIPTPTTTSSLAVAFYDDCFIVPAFIDAQVYGAAKKS